MWAAFYNILQHIAGFYVNQQHLQEYLYRKFWNASRFTFPTLITTNSCKIIIIIILVLMPIYEIALLIAISNWLHFFWAFLWIIAIIVQIVIQAGATRPPLRSPRRPSFEGELPNAKGLVDKKACQPTVFHSPRFWHQLCIFSMSFTWCVTFAAKFTADFISL